VLIGLFEGYELIAVVALEIMRMEVMDKLFFVKNSK
jgi:hypothetical protein